MGNTVNALAVFNDKLYVGGAFVSLGDVTISAKYIAAWNGTEWTTLTCGSSNGLGADVYALAAFNGKLYVGGAFNTLGNSSSAKNIAAWDGSTWSTL
jgi:trimeric autotransporter adhesin